MTQPVQPEALRLAAWLNEGAWHNITLGDVNAAGRELRKLQAETERLTAALKKANEQAEHFEREWYLRGDKLEQLEAELAQLRESKPLSDEQIDALFDMRDGAMVSLAEIGRRFARKIERAHGIGEKTHG